MYRMPIGCFSRVNMRGYAVALLFLSMSLCTAYTAGAAAPLFGAEEIISQVKKSLGADGAHQADPDQEKAARLTRDIEAFRSRRSTLPVNEAVESWLNLYDRFWMLPPSSLAKTRELNPGGSDNDAKLSVVSLLSAIPPPKAWDKMKERVLSRPTSTGGPQDGALKILLFFLNGDRKNIEKSVAELTASSVMSSDQAKYIIRSLRTDGGMTGKAKEGREVVDAFEAYLRSLQTERLEGRVTVNVPDIAPVAGEKRTTDLILKAMVIPGISLRVPSGGATLQLTKRTVRDNPGKLVAPHWDLVTSIQDGELYEAFIKHFPDKDVNKQALTSQFQEKQQESYGYEASDASKRRAAIFYVMGLVASNRIKDAVAQASTLEPKDVESGDFERIWQSFEKIRYSAELTQFCRTLLAGKPELPLWGHCGVVASTPEARQDLVSIVEAAARRTDISLASRLTIRERYVDVLLAIDRTGEAIKVLREVVALDTTKESQPVQSAAARVKFKFIARLCMLGKLLGKPQLINDGAGKYLALVRGAGLRMEYGSWGGSDDSSTTGTVINALLDIGEFAQAETIALAELRSLMDAPELGAVPNRREMLIANGMLAGSLVRFVTIYDRAKRPNDVLALLEQSPWWGALDLIDVAEMFRTLPPAVARALHQAGKEADAAVILKGHLAGYPSDDAAYAALVDIAGTTLIPWLDELYARDRFEERPLIWKAHLLKQLGKLEEAETTVRQAIKIDPTDGEEKAGDRGRAYRVLGDVLKARSKKEDALFFDRVVESIQIAEEGDAFAKAGLLRRSLSFYEKAADLFADAYCVQWRLAERLSSIGDHEGARKHYEIAFERMPEQFGRVASFCFGCEGVFTHQQSQSVAEQVLARLEKATPQKPQVQFLLGQLRESQERKAEAYRHYRKAAELDPQYLDAWKAAYALRSDIFLSRDEIDEIALQMVRQDPMQRHSSAGLEEITDQRGLWAIYEETGKSKFTIPARLYELTASKKALESMMEKYGMEKEYFEMRRRNYTDRRVIPAPGETIAKNRFVVPLFNWLLSTSARL